MREFLRITNIKIENIKNVSKGIINFSKNDEIDIGDITGIYGQNGSGKTAFIDSMAILKSILLCDNLNFLYDMINVNSDICKINIQFYFQSFEKKYDIEFEFKLKKEIQILDNTKIKKIVLVDETIKFINLENKKTERKKILVSSSINELLKQKETYKKIIEKKQLELKIAKKLSEERGTSFLFSSEFIEILKNENNKSYSETIQIIEKLKQFGTYELIIITNENMGLINLNTNHFPLNIRTKNSVGRFIITDKNIVISENMSEELQKVISQINTVISSIIPDMKLELFESRKEILEDGKTSIVFQLLSIRDEKKIPFRNESDGIKKIISILSSLIAVYHNENLCLIIDELDAGVFEYLLGELLLILSEGIKGQLIFTSHNLRILEKLNKECLVFTTTNKNNRYIRLKNIKPSNNIRDFFIREIIMQEQNEKLYEETNNGDIDSAFYKAGEIYGNKK